MSFRNQSSLGLMKTLLITALVALAISISTSRAQSHGEESLYHQLSPNASNATSTAALDRVLSSSEHYSAGILYVACAVAFNKKRLEDAGFLLYVARFRSRFDKALFPPRGTGGNNPMLACGAAHQQLGEVVNPAITAEPKVYARVLDRVKSWKPQVAADYHPGWEYLKRESEKKAEEAVADNRKQVINGMTGTCTLLQDATYFKAFRTGQDYNLMWDSNTNRPSRAAYDAALETMARIETEKGIPGIATLREK